MPQKTNQLPYFKIKQKLEEQIAANFLLRKFRPEIKNPFLRQTDDYLIFCKNKKEPHWLLKTVILPKLSDLGLEINEKKLKSGKFYQDKVDFIGFEFYAGYFRIKPEKIEEFREKIRKLTYLTKNKSKTAVIKSLNNQIPGFGHYYKFVSAKKEFEELDGFVRMRLRRYIARNKDSKNKEGNLLLTNSVLKKLGLKSLLTIKEKYARKKRHFFRKKTENKSKTGKSTRHMAGLHWEEIEFKYQQKLILAELKQLTSLVKKLKRKITK